MLCWESRPLSSADVQSGSNQAAPPAGENLISTVSPAASVSGAFFNLNICFTWQHGRLDSLWHEELKCSSQNWLQANVVQLLRIFWSLQMHTARRPFESGDLDRPEVGWALWCGAYSAGTLVLCWRFFPIKNWQLLPTQVTARPNYRCANCLILCRNCWSAPPRLHDTAVELLCSVIDRWEAVCCEQVQLVK